MHKHLALFSQNEAKNIFFINDLKKNIWTCALRHTLYNFEWIVFIQNLQYKKL